jgi:hypothetical protein
MQQSKPQYDFRGATKRMKEAEQSRPPESAANDTESELKRLDEIGERLGFESREPKMRLERVRAVEPNDVLSIKGPISALNEFKLYASEYDGLAYWRVLGEILKKARKYDELQKAAQ